MKKNRKRRETIRLRWGEWKLIWISNTPIGSIPRNCTEGISKTSLTRSKSIKSAIKYGSWKILTKISIERYAHRILKAWAAWIYRTLKYLWPPANVEWYQLQFAVFLIKSSLGKKNPFIDEILYWLEFNIRVNRCVFSSDSCRNLVWISWKWSGDVSREDARISAPL